MRHLSLLALLLTVAVASAADRYQRIEVAMTNTTAFGNPFTETELRLDVRAPTGRALGERFTWYGFHDGDGAGGQDGEVWKFRLLLDTPGTWEVDAGFFVPGTSTRNGPSRSFSWTVDATPASADEHGHVRVDPRDPMRFAFDDGTPWVPFPIHGSMLLDRDAFADSKRWIDEHASRGVNAMGVRFHAESEQIGETNAIHFLGSDGRRTTSTNNGDQDHARYDVASWRHNERVIEYAQQQGIRLFIWFGISGKNRQYGSYGPLDHSDDGSTVTLGARQRQFIRYFLARWATYTGWWHWTVDSEWEETGGPGTANQRFQIAYARALRAQNPWRTQVSVHSLRDWRMGGSDQGWDLVTTQKRVGTSDGEATSDSLAFVEGNDHHGIPVFNEEGVWYLPTTRSRIATLTHLMAGGYSHVAHTATDGSHRTSSWGANWPTVSTKHKDDAAMVGRLARFFNRDDIDLNGCRPRHDLVTLSGGNLALCLADPGERYLVWLDRGGRASLDLSGVGGSFRVTRYDGSALPASGGGSDLGTIAGGGTRDLGATPDSGFGNDWLYLVEAVGAALTVTAPNGGETLVAGGGVRVTWTSVGTSGAVDIHLSPDNGASWTQLADDTADDGSHQVTLPDVVTDRALIRVRDADGSPGDRSDAAFALVRESDTTAPTVTIASPGAGSTQGAAFTLGGSASDDSGIDRVEWRVDGGSWRSASGTTAWSANVNGLASGAHTLEVRAIDGADPSNTSSPVSRSVTVDADGPSVDGLAVTTTATTAVITWTSDEPADSRVQWGTTSGLYEGETGVVEDGVTRHRVELTGLEPDTDHVFIVITGDAYGNATTTAERVFTTAAASGPGPAPVVTVESVSTGKAYAPVAATVGTEVYLDRAYSITALGSALAGQVLVQTANNDKGVTADDHLRLRADRPVTVYVCYDVRASSLPSWLDGWSAVEDPAVAVDVTDAAAPYVIRGTSLAADTSLVLGGNRTGGGNGGSHYLVFVASAGAVDPEVPTSLAINFQPAGAPAVEGYLVDDGSAFGDRGDGRRYGWDVDNGATRDRNLDADQRYDTLNHLQKSGDRTWELELPAGVYRVRLAAGDPGYRNQVNSFELEGVLLGDPDGQDHQDEFDELIEVTDGRLTLRPAAGASNAKIQFIEVTSAGGNG